MYILGEEAMVSNPQGFVAGGHVARSTGGHLPYSGLSHPSHHCGHTNLHGSQGRKLPVNPVSGLNACAYLLNECVYAAKTAESPKCRNYDLLEC